MGDCKTCNLLRKYGFYDRICLDCSRKMRRYARSMGRAMAKVIDSDLVKLFRLP